jgi:hypothetical protein
VDAATNSQRTRRGQTALQRENSRGTGSTRSELSKTQLSLRPLLAARRVAEAALPIDLLVADAGIKTRGGQHQDDRRGHVPVVYDETAPEG